ncbi:MAG: tRNA (adenosine(37)-N6)-threonylcarbamoyltransferase complex dimerization subunit type 1 TsaB [Oscillospiraceae bacterium]|nr:tRNA (adenosine(37)-N6)-threonylcarbamoyltransferase complex dimerization subunit type 1 TsaB [Oscillospiraceae bacterium]
MKLLSIDCSAGPASVAVTENGRILASAYINLGRTPQRSAGGHASSLKTAESSSAPRITHSQTLLPMVEAMLQNSRIPLEEIGGFAISAGPGSFTGTRIGIAAVKGLAFSADLPCLPVSTLEAIAMNFLELPLNGIICAAMDARCEQIYTAFFRIADGEIRRLTEDMALAEGEARERLEAYGEPVYLAGDGAELCYERWQDKPLKCVLAPPQLRYQQAAGVATAAERMLAAGQAVSAADLMPVYLRAPQAERERQERK